MSPVFEKKSDSTKLTPSAGQKLADLLGAATLEEFGLFNWGTKEKPEINRALVELVGCRKVDPADPSKSELDPTLVTSSVIHEAKLWKSETPLEIGKTHTFKLKKSLAMPAVEITELTPWFSPNAVVPNTPATCTIKYRVEGHASRGDKTDLEVHVARYRDRKGKSESSYYEIKETLRETEASRALAPDNPIEYNEAQCGTDGDGDTHIWRGQKTGVVPSSAEVTEVWDGESKATKGVLGPPKTGPAKVYINSSCAPYSVLVRYYKNDADKVATITFDESFYPRWKVEHGGTRKLDPASLVVRWTVKHGPSEKLELGQLQVFDKHNAVVCRVPLGKDKFKAGANELDLAPLWPESEVKRDAMPYRTQIQAHSGPDEADGLAIAVMPTQVRAYEYDQVQFLAFNVRPGSPYMGDLDHDTDIAARCVAMIDAVRTVKPQADADPKILKIFMAPEFYFRGLEGAYPVEKIETIMPKLREEADKIEYADWMFVFGSAIGYQKHDEAGAEIVHENPLHDCEIEPVSDTVVKMKPSGTDTTVMVPEGDCWLWQGATMAYISGVVEDVDRKEHTLTLAWPAAFAPGPAMIESLRLNPLEIHPPMSAAVTRVLMAGSTASRIPSTTVGGKRWKIRQGANESKIIGSAPHATNDNQFWLTLETPGPFLAHERAELVEPMSTEVTNVALVQKGYPTPHMGNGGLRSVGIYKEKVSPIDFFNKAKNWHKADARHRRIKIHQTKNRPVLPTYGSDDLSGANPNVTRVAPALGTAGSEINSTGYGGGVVYTMDDITFGLEVCLDHAEDRLAKFYSDTSTTKAAGDPTVQVHLIPSWGMSIGQGEICCPSPTGAVFNVDGARCESVARLYDGVTWSCDDHPEIVGARGTTCTKNQRYFKCPQCDVFMKGGGPGLCDVHGVALVEYKKCGNPTKYGCNEGCWDKPAPCLHASCRPLWKCLNCNFAELVGDACACAKPKPYAFVCDQEFYRGATCPECNGTITRCNRPLMPLGAEMIPTGAALVVASSGDPYFQRRGSVLAYPAVALPLPDIVV